MVLDLSSLSGFSPFLVKYDVDTPVHLLRIHDHLGERAPRIISFSNLSHLQLASQATSFKGLDSN